MIRAAAFAFLTACIVCGGPAGAEAPAQASATTAPSAVDAARSRAAAGDVTGAIGALAPYSAAHPDDVAALRLLGDLYYRSSDFANAERTDLAALRIAPNDRTIHDRLGAIYAAQDRTREAIAQFELSLPETSAFDSLVELHRRLGDLAHFEIQYRFAATSDPFDAAANFALGTILHAERKNPEAVAFLERAYKLQPLSCPLEAELGSAYLDIGARADAIRVLDECLHRNPNDYAALVNLSDAYDAPDAADKARPLLERAEAIAPDRPEALVDLGYLEDADGHWDNAVAYYRKALAVDPLWRDAYVNLGYDYEEHHLFEPAQAVLLKGLSVSPMDGRLHFLLGMNYALQGKIAEARSQFDSARSSDEPEVAREAAHRLSSLN
jgi:tetratricopeptide (TPR) repeat protein